MLKLYKPLSAYINIITEVVHYVLTMLLKTNKVDTVKLASRLLTIPKFHPIYQLC